MSENLFDKFALDYDRMIDWPNRLKREETFFRAVFTENKVRSVLDAACGTGWHAIHFARQGYGVLGTDVSPGMISVAKENAIKAGIQAEFIRAGFVELVSAVKDNYDAITCLGNSLPHLPTDEQLLLTMAGFYRILNPAGVLIIQIRNYTMAMQENKRFMPLNQWSDEQEEYIFLRLQDFYSDKVQFNIITLRRPKGGKWDYRVDSNELHPLKQEQLTQFLIQSGFSKFDFFGDYQFHPFDEEKHADLIIVATK